MDPSESIWMGFFIGTGVFVSIGASTGFGLGDTGATPGQVFRFGSPNLVADLFGKLHLYGLAPRRAAEASSSPSLGLESPPGEQESWLVATLESLLPVLAYSTDEGEESAGSHHPLLEVFMADQGAATIDSRLSAPIAEQTPEELEATHLQLQAEHERLDEQRAELSRWGRARDRGEPREDRCHPPDGPAQKPEGRPEDRQLHGSPQPFHLSTR